MSELVTEYLTTPSKAFWQWQDEHGVVAWQSGDTIVFRAELVAVFEKMPAEAIPTLSPLLILLAALRPSWRDGINRIVLHRWLTGQLSAESPSHIDRLLAELDRVHHLAEPLGLDSAGRGVLAAMVFERGKVPLVTEVSASPTAAGFLSPVRGPTASEGLRTLHRELIDVLRTGLPESVSTPRETFPNSMRMVRDLIALERGLTGLDAAQLQQRLATGFEQDVRPAPVEPPEPGDARGLIDALLDDHELGGVARLAKRLLASVDLPAPLLRYDELPLGGVSDITNRGSLDRLLLSELAYDDLTLSVRVAMNEALYLRREAPPAPPIRRRLVLLDAGLRMWGLPRVYAAAIGLSLAAGATPRVSVTVFRSEGQRLAPVDLSRVEGLKAHLGVVRNDLHPGPALPALVERAQQEDEATDLVVVTSADTYADPRFLEDLGRSGARELFVAVVSRDGTFELRAHTLRGRKTVRKMELALEEILATPARPAVPLLDTRGSVPLEIFRQPAFPLRLSSPIDAERSWYVRDYGALTVTGDGRLLLWTDRRLGARQLAEGLPPGTVQWAQHFLDNGRAVCVIGRRAQHGMHIVSIDTHMGDAVCVTPLETELPFPRGLCVRAGCVFVFDDNRITVSSLWSGKQRAATWLPYRHVFGYEFRERVSEEAAAGRYVVFYDGQNIGFARVPEPSANGVSLHMETGLPSAWSRINFSRNGYTLRRHEGDSVCEGMHALNAPVQLGISRDGLRVVFGDPSRPHAANLLVDLQHGFALQTGSSVNTVLEQELFSNVRSVSLRHRFMAIGFDADKRLTLIGRAATQQSYFQFEQQYRVLRLTPPVSTFTALPLRIDFADYDTAVRPNYNFRIAKFPGGGFALLDARGLLHLKSAKADLPEVAIVLTDGATAGWCTDGNFWGSEYFLGNHPTDPTQTLPVVRQVIVALRDELAEGGR